MTWISTAFSMFFIWGLCATLYKSLGFATLRCLEKVFDTSSQMVVEKWWSIPCYQPVKNHPKNKSKSTRVRGFGRLTVSHVNITKTTGGRIPRILSHFLGDVEVHTPPLKRGTYKSTYQHEFVYRQKLTSSDFCEIRGGGFFVLSPSATLGDHPT